MAIFTDAFPTLSQEMIKKSGHIDTNYKFLFLDNGIERELKAAQTEASNSKVSILKLEDEAGHWHPDTHELTIECTSYMTCPVFFFGPKGIIPRKGTLGVAIRWMAPETSVRGVKDLGEITLHSDTSCGVSCRIAFPRRLLRGELILQTILYLKNRGAVAADEKHLAAFTGTVLGVMDVTKIIIDSNGSMFPIHTVNNPTEPLWWAKCEWEDPTEDAFTDDNFCLYLNAGHKDYALLNANEGIKNSPLLMDIICSALHMMIIKVLGDDNYSSDTINGNNLKQGSISALIHYYIRVFGWDYEKEHPEKLAQSIRKSLMEMVSRR